MLYGGLAVMGLAPWYFNLQAFGRDPMLDLVGFYRLGFANPAAASLTVDLMVAFVVFAVWVLPEAARLGMRRAWLYPVLGFFVSLAFAFPLFLMLRERRLRVCPPAHEPPGLKSSRSSW
jgi:Protein of unknown function DUF2834